MFVADSYIWSPTLRSDRFQCSRCGRDQWREIYSVCLVADLYVSVFVCHCLSKEVWSVMVHE